MIQRLLLTALLTALLVIAPAHSQHRPLPQYKKNTDFFLELGKGNVPGHTLMAKFGENPDLNTIEGFEVIWDAGGVYVPPTQARIHNVLSSLPADAGTVITSGTATGGSVTSLIDADATFVTDSVAVGDLILNDTNVEIGVVTAVSSETVLAAVRSMRDPSSGEDSQPNEFGDAYRIVRDASTGTSVLHIIGLSAFFLEQDEFVVTNGQSNVATANNYIRQFRARVFSSASANAAGTITSTTIGESVETVTLQVINGNNQTLMAVYTIPSDKVGMLVRWWGSMSKKQSASSVVNLRAGQIDKIGYIVQNRSVKSNGSSAFDHEFKIPILFPGGSDMWIEADTDTNAVGFAGGFDIVLIDQS
jgi:hypothetical protein